MIHVHELDGCAPAPLVHYLKALGILRLVAEQVDENVRGWWKGNRFLLATGLTKEELEGFFLREYQPTPFVSPWNKGAGFFSEEDSGIHPLENSTSRRFESFRSGIEASRSRLEQLSKADKSVGAVAGASETAWYRFRHFTLSRRRGPQPPIAGGFAVRLEFGRPVPGPIALGYGSHFGLGLFGRSTSVRSGDASEG